MAKDTYKTVDFEVLVATMNRSSLDFLENMFIRNDMGKFRILVLNQTNPDKILKSEHPKIRIINSFEKGLTKSRNLALKNSSAKFCLITDDDVVFLKGFDKIIERAIQNFPEAALLSFKVQNEKGKDYRSYPNNNIKHNHKTIKRLMSVEMVINSNFIKKNKIYFDERFGLGSEFETAEEYLFARSLIKETKDLQFINEAIVLHGDNNSGQNLGSDQIVKARAVLNYKIYGYIGYIWLLKYILFLIRKKFIDKNEFYHKYRIGIKGIQEYKGKKSGK